MIDLRDEMELLKRHIRAVIADPDVDEKYIEYLLRRLIEMRRAILK